MRCAITTRRRRWCGGGAPIRRGRTPVRRSPIRASPMRRGCAGSGWCRWQTNDKSPPPGGFSRLSNGTDSGSAVEPPEPRSCASALGTERVGWAGYLPLALSVGRGREPTYRVGWTAKVPALLAGGSTPRQVSKTGYVPRLSTWMCLIPPSGVPSAAAHPARCDHRSVRARGLPSHCTSAPTLLWMTASRLALTLTLSPERRAISHRPSCRAVVTVPTRRRAPRPALSMRTTSAQRMP